VEEVERKVKDGCRHRLSVHMHVLLQEMPAARPHKQHRNLHGMTACKAGRMQYKFGHLDSMQGEWAEQNHLIQLAYLRVIRKSQVPMAAEFQSSCIRTDPKTGR